MLLVSPYHWRRSFAIVAGAARLLAISASSAALRVATAIVCACTARAAVTPTPASATSPVPVPAGTSAVPRMCAAEAPRATSRAARSGVASPPLSTVAVSRITWATVASSSRSAAEVRARSRCPSKVSETRAAHHSSTWTAAFSPWSAVASPVGRNGVALNVSTSVCLAATIACMLVTWPREPFSMLAASSRARAAADARSRSPADGVDSSSTAAVPAADASHQPASRSGIVAAPPADATGRTYASSAAVTPDAAFGPITPAKKTANATGIVTRAASHADLLARVPMMSRTLPATARPMCATSLSLRVPPKLASTSVANPPNAANSAICRLPRPL